MKRIIDAGSGIPSIKNVKHLPYPGRYHALIYDVCTRVIEPLNEEKFCMVVSYKLVHETTGDLFDFVEIYNTSDTNTRVSDFVAFVENQCGSAIDDHNIVGIMADVDIVNEYIGGFMHPVISYRRYGIDKAVQAYGDETRSIY